MSKIDRVVINDVWYGLFQLDVSKV